MRTNPGAIIVILNASLVENHALEFHKIRQNRYEQASASNGFPNAETKSSTLKLLVSALA